MCNISSPFFCSRWFGLSYMDVYRIKHANIRKEGNCVYVFIATFFNRNKTTIHKWKSSKLLPLTIDDRKMTILHGITICNQWIHSVYLDKCAILCSSHLNVSNDARFWMIPKWEKKRVKWHKYHNSRIYFPFWTFVYHRLDSMPVLSIKKIFFHIQCILHSKQCTITHHVNLPSNANILRNFIV